MKFCPKCETYLVSHIRSSDAENPNKLLEYNCFNCGYKEILDISAKDTDKCIYKTRTEVTKIKIYSQNLKYLKYDNTLPHIDNINCPNEKCPTKSADSKLQNDILYMNLNDNMLIYLYQCTHCDYTWTNK